MSGRLARAFLAGASIVVLNMPSTYAQTAAPATDQAAAGGLEEITVTARRREEKLQSVPIAITAYTGIALKEQQIQTSEELSHIVPSLSINGPFGNGIVTNLRLRGLPGVATYFAEVPTFLNGSATSLSGNALFVDLQNVQVLKGPQGVAFGINTTGGAILFEPQKPTNDFEGYADITVGDYGRYELESAVNIPIVEDKLLVRFAVDRQQQDGYTHDIKDNIDFNNTDYWYGRASVTFRPTDDFENYTVADYYFSDDNGPGVVLTYVNPKLAGGFLPKLGVDLIAQKALGVRQTVGVDPGLMPIDKQQNFRILDIARWDVTDNLTIKNIASYSHEQELQRIDLDGAPENGISIVGGPQWGGNAEGLPDDEAFTEELQFSGKVLDDKLQWVAGGYLSFNHPGGAAGYGSDVFGGLSITNYVFPADHGTSARTQAIYAQGTYDLSALSPVLDGLKFTGGYRYNWDWRTAESTTFSGKGACATAGADPHCVLVQDAAFHAFGWTAGLDYQILPETLVYVRADRGYSAGGFNPYTAGSQYRIYKPEFDTNVEIGLKSDWELGGVKARTNIDAFHVAYTNIQRNVTVSFINAAGGTSIGNLTNNAASATVEGVEFQGTVEPFQGVELTPSISYIYSKYNQYISIDPTTLKPVDLSGQAFTNFPKTQLSLIARYHLPIDAAYGDVSVSTTYSWQSSLYFGLSPTTVAAYEPAYDNLDLRFDWKNVMQRPVDVAFFITNVADNVHRLGSFNLYESVGTVGDVYNAPRMFGFELRYRFGPNEPGLGL